MQLDFVSALSLAVSTQIASAVATPMGTRDTSLNPRGSWLLELYESGCPGGGKDSTSTGAMAGSEGDEIWCNSVVTSHNVVASNMGNMDVWLFADRRCEHEVAHIGMDGCTAIPSNYVVEAVRVLPKKKAEVLVVSYFCQRSWYTSDTIMKHPGAITPLMAFAAFGQTTSNYTSPLGVDIYNPAQLFTASGPWSMMSRAGNTLYISGMRGFYPSNTTLAPVGHERVYQAFANMKQLAELGGSDLTSCVRLQVFVTDMYRWRPVVNQVQEELWRDVAPNYPPRTILEVQRLNDDDIVEIEGTFYLGD
ncbi:hypothetical protein PG991_016233 [Apiospora marii]|uniref:Uncharacterized protein n=2 Tax=Apiospora marii TaxID=335849 RepID=A0ABR1R123_9PEZI